MKNIWKKITEHKFVSIIVIALIAWGGYYEYGRMNSNAGEVQYTLTAVIRGTLVTSVGGTGQVSVLNQVDIKPLAAGSIISIPIVAGQQVKQGQILARLDDGDAQKAVRDAKANLESAKISLAKLKEPADALSVTQANNAITQAEQAKQNATSGIVKAYDDGFNQVSNAFLNLPSVVSGLDGILNGNALSNNQSNAYAYYDLIKSYNPNAESFRDAALNSFATARSNYEKNLLDYRATTRFSERQRIDDLIEETYDTTKAVAEATRNTKNFLDLINDTFTSNGQTRKAPTLLSTHLASTQAYTGTTNTDLGNLLNIRNSIKNDLDAFANADRTITEKTQSLQKLQAGANALDVRSQELAVAQRENALRDVEDQLPKYYVRAPFDGVISIVNSKPGDSASQGTAIATVITKQQVAQISLNEVDVAKIKAQDKATATFDAIQDLSITGLVAQIDAVGTVSQGVVTYNVKVAFDTQDERIKPGMSVSVSVITDVKQNVLMVPNAAVKSQGASRYVQILGAASSSAGKDQTAATNMQSGKTAASKIAPLAKTVTVGASNDTMTEIVSGLFEGDEVVLRAVSAASQAATNSTSQSGFRIPGLGGGGPGR